MPLTYAIGDIHGSLAKLESLIARCRTHCGEQTMRLVFLGDYIDRGPHSAGVIELVMRLQSEMKERVITLMGNHEALALAAAAGDSPETWLFNGGVATLLSYGVTWPDELPQAHIQWMQSLRMTYDDQRRFFVHAGIDPQRPLDDQSVDDMLWIREPFLSDARDFGRLIVHGHTPLSGGQPELHKNRLNLDTAAVFGGPLTAAVFGEQQTEPLTFLQAP